MDNDVPNKCFHKPEKEKCRNSYCLFQRTCKLNNQCHDNMIVNNNCCVKLENSGLKKQGKMILKILQIIKLNIVE